VDEPTHRDGKMLDFVITAETSTLCGKLTVTDPGISDHQLIAADLQVGRLKPIVRQYRYRNVLQFSLTVCADNQFTLILLTVLISLLVSLSSRLSRCSMNWRR